MTISKLTDDLKISSLKEMISPSDLIAELPLSESAIKTVIDCRSEIIKILNGEDKRLMLIVNKTSYKLNRNEINKLLEKIKLD